MKAALTEKWREYKSDFCSNTVLQHTLKFKHDCRHLGRYYCWRWTVWTECSLFAEEKGCQTENTGTGRKRFVKVYHDWKFWQHEPRYEAICRLDSFSRDLLKRGTALTKSCVVSCADRVGGRTVTSELRSASGVDRWDLGGQWVGR